jgi:uncharacterized protein YgiM (DUF1202 family)
MKTLNLALALKAVMCFFVASAFAASTMWVSSENARLKADSSASSATLATLPVGTKVSVGSTEGRWYKIETDGGEKGWIYRGRLSDTPPEAETAESDNLFAAMGSSSISADEAQTSRSIRGLSKETEQYAKKRGTPEKYKKMLDLVLAIRITDQQLDAFLKSGKIGEYAP